MKSFIKIIASLWALVLPLAMRAQNNVEMADRFRADGKIYVVVAVVLIILAGLMVYLVATERRLKKLEDEINKV